MAKKPFEELTIADDFMFCKVMEHESICKEAYFKVLDFAKDSIKFYNQKEVYNYKIK